MKETLITNLEIFYRQLKENYVEAKEAHQETYEILVEKYGDSVEMADMTRYYDSAIKQGIGATKFCMSMGVPFDDVESMFNKFKKEMEGVR